MKLVQRELIKTNYYALDKKNCLDEMVELLYENEIIKSQDEFLAAILERENMMSTGIGRNIAIPHARGRFVSEMRLAIFVLNNELDYNSIDDEPVKLIFMIAIPADESNNYMKVLAAISNFCHSDENREKLMNASNEDEVYEILKTLSVDLAESKGE
ncbi:MAG: PTS sugar transporter subunit IIA [Candidatus Cloacimonetes bacterium]|nr:PTS sugar transporter subunit IIA [Candidatus Cloacimonadota bacterium]